MAQFDFPLERLQSYFPEREEPEDFDAFWERTLAEARSLAVPAVSTPQDTALERLLVDDVTFSGFGGHPIRAWFVRPPGPLRGTVVQFIGYSGGRGVPEQYTLLPSAGYGHFIVDNRGQGNLHHAGATPDPVGSGPHIGGLVSFGIERPEDYYYRRVFTDAALAVEAARAHPSVDRVAVAGSSQGGGIALAAAALAEDVSAALIDVPFLSHFRRAVQVTEANPYNELARYLQTRRGEEDEVFRVLSYFDGVNLATRATAPALYSVGLYDNVCPPSTVYAQFNHYAGTDKSIHVYPYNGHEGGQWVQQREHLAFLCQVFGPAS